MYKRNGKYLIDGGIVKELINGNWYTIAYFHYQDGSDKSPEWMAEAIWEKLNEQ